MILLLWFYHPALNKVHEILKKAHRYTMCLPRLSVVLPSLPQVALPNPKTLKDHLARSKLKILVEILQLRAKFETAMVSCLRFIWITNSSDHRRV